MSIPYIGRLTIFIGMLLFSKYHRAELANSLTHGLGFIISLVGVVLLLSVAIKTHQVLLISSVGLYAASLLLTYLSSTMYHSVHNPARKKLLRIMDHISIFLLIGGSYTPFVILYLNRGLGWTFLSLLWILIAIGSFMKIFYTHKFPRLSTAIYLLLGWMALLIWRPMLQTVPHLVLLLIISGGLFYTFGVVFFVWKKWTHHHAIWHLFVMGGSACHFAAIYYGLSMRPEFIIGN